MSLSQLEDESVETFMNRIKELSADAFRSLPDKERQVLEFTAFCLGLSDKTAARFVAVEAKGNSAAPIRIASAAVTDKKKDKSFPKNRNKKSNKFFYVGDDGPKNATLMGIV